ncbi:MAG: hypothetical protein WC314_01930 [Vulcanimicrobiota bacterium]
MKTRCLSLVLAVVLCCLPGPALAQDHRPEFERFEQLKPDDAQMQEIFSLLLGGLPYILDESADAEAVIRELAPQAMQVLRPEQRRFLAELAPPELERFGSMNREERKRFVLEQARTLIHPSKQEWLDRVEEMTR